MLSNITRSKNLYRYEQSVKDYAVSLYILGGRNVYDFVRLNIPGFIPNLTSLRSILTSSKKYFIEGEFQYERFNEFIELSDCKYAFCGEDSTSVVSKVCYDSRSNSFVGFPLPLKDGFPCSRYFPTNSFGELEQWYEKIDKSFLINVHVIQAVCPSNRTSPSPFLLAAYGTNSKYTARDILNRWSKTFDSFMTQNIRILGFSSDCDPKQMKAMRDSMGFFSNEHTGFECHPDHFKISLFKIIKCIELTFVEKSTNVIDRVYNAWCAVFIVRIWYAWLQTTNSDELNKKVSHSHSTVFNEPIPKRNFFIAIPTLFSLELNAHSLTYLVILYAEQKITEEALNIALFNSQMCFRTFRVARSMSGPFSSVVNFSVYEFLQGVEKLAVLQSIKWSSESKENNIIFPKHHKQSKKTSLTRLTSTITITVTEQALEVTVFSAYLKANQILSVCGLSILNPYDKMISFEEVNRLAYKKLSRSKCTTSNKKHIKSNENDDENEDDDEDEDEDEDEDNEQHRSNRQRSESDIVDEHDESTSIDDFDLDILLNVSRSTIRGMHIFDSIDNSQADSFFPGELNGRIKYMHKKTAKL
ncbi:unnamed protein product, partial [Rotaria socialis]